MFSPLSKSHITLSEAIKFGWNDTDLKSSVDALVIPSLRLDENKTGNFSCRFPRQGDCCC